jgi:hypothetical protein
MPTVPTYDLPTVGLEAGSPGTFATPSPVAPMPDVVGKDLERMGAATVAAGATVKKVADQIRYDIADADVKALDNRMSEEQRKLLHDPTDGYLAKPGKAAIDAREPAIKALEKQQQAIIDELQNEGKTLELAMFKQVAQKRMQISLNQIDLHALQQTKIYDIGEGKARINNAIDDAAANWTTWNQKNSPYAAFKATAVQEAELLADKMGLPKDAAQRKELVMGTTTKLHTDVINNLLSKDNAPAAAAYFQANIKEIASDKTDELAKSVRSVGERDQSLRLSMTLTGTLSEQQAALTAQFRDGKISASIYDQTRQRIEHNWSQEQGQKAVFEKAILGQAQDWLLQNPGKTALDLPSSLYNNLKNTGHLATIQNFAKGNKMSYENDPRTWGQVLDMSQAALAEMTTDQFYVRYRGKLDDQHLERGMAMVAGARGDTKKAPDYIATRTLSEEITFAAKNSKIIPFSGTPSEAQQKRFALFDTAINNQLRLLQQSLPNQRKPTLDESKKVIDQVLTDKVKIDEWFNDPETPISLVTPDQLSKAYVTVGGRDIFVSKIPAADREKYAGKLRSNNIPVTQAAIAAMWAADNPKGK